MVADEQDQDVVHRVDEGEHIHRCTVASSRDAGEALDDHDDGGVHLDVGRGRASLGGSAEHAAVEVKLMVRGGGAERGDDDELTTMVAAMGSPPLKSTATGAASTMSATMQKTVAGRVAQAVGECVDDAVAVVGDGGGARAVEEHGGDGDADDAVREHVQHGGVVECPQAGDLDAEGGVRDGEAAHEKTKVTQNPWTRSR